MNESPKHEVLSNLDKNVVDRVVTVLGDLINTALTQANRLPPDQLNQRVQELDAYVILQTKDFDKYLEELDPVFKAKARAFHEKGIDQSVIAKDVLRYTIYMDISNQLLLLHNIFSSISEEQDRQLDAIALELHQTSDTNPSS